MPTRLSLALLGLAVLAGPTLAQSPVAVAGTVVDAETGAALPGATVFLIAEDSTQTGAAADVDGAFRLAVAPGAYRLRVTFVGYVAAERALAVTEAVDLGAIELTEDAEALGDVEVEATRQRVEVRGDTTAFRADAFPVNPDADAGDLVEKLPGVAVENGTVTAEGETVRRVLVDGREFFGTDVQAALATLPAEIIQEVQVFDRQSDAARFSGFDDGEAEKTINIVTRPGMGNGQFGRAYAGAGPEGSYLAGGNMTILSGDRRVTVVGLANNVDQQNFATEDLLGVAGGGGRGGRGRGRGRGGSVGDLLVDDADGINETTALGVSYSDKLFDEALELEGSYFFNTTDNRLDAALTRSYLTNGAVSQLYGETELSEGTNTNHRLSLRAEADLSERTQLTVRPQLSVQSNASTGSLLGLTTLPAGDLLAETNSVDTADLDALSGGVSAFLRHRFDTNGRTLTLGVDGSANGQDGVRNQAYTVTGRAEDDDVDQLVTTDAGSQQVGARLEYTEPIAGGQLQLSYRPQLSWGSSDRLASLADATGTYTLPDSAYSSVLDQRSLVQQAGVAFRFGSGGRGGERGSPRGDRGGEGGRERGGRSGLSAQIGVDVQHERLEAEQLLPTAFTVDRSYWSVLPSARLRFGLGETGRVNLDYRTRTQTPSASQLQDVIDNRNPLLLTTGNPDLQPSTTHSVRARFNRTDAEGGSVLFGLLSGTYGQNAVVTSTTLATGDAEIAPGVVLPAGAQLTRPVNLDGYWNARALATYGRPVGLLKSNANVSLGASYSSTPGLVDGYENVTDQLGIDGRLFLGSAISERLDFSLEYGARYTAVTNSAVPSLDDDYVRHQAGAELTWLPVPYVVLATDVRALHYAGLDASVDPTQVLWGGRIGYKFLTDDLAEVSLSFADLLDQQADVERTVTELYVEDAQSQALGRTVMLNLSYKLRTFGQ
ncbi:TonB-dependent receptor [Rubrivirga marina]|uniref:Outer membrane protein beta-barrel domain-containing protein n=1 Tax=Rubrivirga marina TaxID=1196024 RepID=A0A271J781_9BACT|nr:TonB-dependent receptor [Rubrivirga marina]PAP78499.1 hypothetical protein BSZ37_19755 [Rubrivirga marina]